MMTGKNIPKINILEITNMMIERTSTKAAADMRILTIDTRRENTRLKGEGQEQMIDGGRGQERKKEGPDLKMRGGDPGQGITKRNPDQKKTKGNLDQGHTRKRIKNLHLILETTETNETIILTRMKKQGMTL